VPQRRSTLHHEEVRELPVLCEAHRARHYQIDPPLPSGSVEPNRRALPTMGGSSDDRGTVGTTVTMGVAWEATVAVTTFVAWEATVVAAATTVMLATAATARFWSR
jgi:hypothetical protein